MLTQARTASARVLGSESSPSRRMTTTAVPTTGAASTARSGCRGPSRFSAPRARHPCGTANRRPGPRVATRRMSASSRHTTRHIGAWCPTPCWPCTASGGGRCTAGCHDPARRRWRIHRARAGRPWFIRRGPRSPRRMAHGGGGKDHTNAQRAPRRCAPGVAAAPAAGTGMAPATRSPRRWTDSAVQSCHGSWRRRVSAAARRSRVQGTTSGGLRTCTSQAARSNPCGCNVWERPVGRPWSPVARVTRRCTMHGQGNAMCRSRSLESCWRSQDARAVWRGAVGKGPHGTSLAAYPTASPVLNEGDEETGLVRLRLVATQLESGLSGAGGCGR